MTVLRRLAAPFVALSLLGAPAAAAADGPPPVAYTSFTVQTAHGPAVVYLVSVDLRRANLDLLHPAAVAQRETVSAMAAAQHALAGINGDFFNITETHDGIAATGSSDGPEIAEHRDLKFAVPEGQRFGPAMPPGATSKIVFGTGDDGRARVSTLELVGAVRAPEGTFDIDGLNQYALPVNGIGVYTHDWGAVSRARAACGTDADGSAGCTGETAEVVVRHGVVVSETETLGAGDIPADTVVLAGRESGATKLEELKPGEHVTVGTRLAAGDLPPFRFAVGGFPILAGGRPVSGLDTVTLAPRTAAGVSADGHTVYLMAVDGRTAASTGMSEADLASVLRSAGAASGVNLDGGGSTTIAVAGPGQPPTVRNNPSDGMERPVANGIGAFSR